ncbi:MAG: PIN domain-containing protein [Chitinivibrionales bacterium]|nr:PIN domain-containing protein [Chitinivibrionales bacterium]
MKVVLDTNIYFGWIRERKRPELLLDVYTQKYLSCHVLMELWAGAKSKQAGRTIEKLQKPYLKADRIMSPSGSDFITAGQILSDLPDSEKSRLKNAGFVNDLFIALTAQSIGAMLYTSNRGDFELIAPFVRGLRVAYV